ncbi:MAG: hypothetical protein JW838_10710 [Spirochaetes bacterium]|nr:hypothetical protein [Spirochaetota bacterium]
MKRIAAAICVTMAFTARAALGSTESERSVAQLRTQSRAAASGTVDAAYHNPAGLVGLEKGFHIDAGYRIMAKTAAWSMAYTGGKDEAGSWFIPSFAAVYRGGEGALFVSFFMPEGVEFIDHRKPVGGMPLPAYFSLGLDSFQMETLRNAGLTLSLGGVELPVISYVKAYGYWLKGNLGGAFSLHDYVAFAGGISCGYYEGSRSAGVVGLGTVDRVDVNALGWSGFAGLMLGPPDRSVLSIVYSTRLIAKGTERNVKYHYSRIMERRIPDSLSIGLNIKSSEGASLQLSYRVDFTGERGFGTRNILTKSHEFSYFDWAAAVLGAPALSLMPLVASGNAENYKHRHRHGIGVGVEFEVSGFAPGIGISYTTQEKYPRAQNPFDPDLARIGVGMGVKIRASEGVSIESGTAYYFFITDRMLFDSIKLNKSAWTWGVSVTIRAG